MASYTPEEIRRLSINVRAIRRARDGVTGQQCADVHIRTAQIRAEREFQGLPELVGIKLQRKDREIELLRAAVRTLADRLADVVEPVDVDHRTPEERSSDWAEFDAEVRLKANREELTAEQVAAVDDTAGLRREFA